MRKNKEHNREQVNDMWGNFVTSSLLDIKILFKYYFNVFLIFMIWYESFKSFESKNVIYIFY